jgi:hypothetical protein
MIYHEAILKEISAPELIALVVLEHEIDENNVLEPRLCKKQRSGPSYRVGRDHGYGLNLLDTMPNELFTPSY